MRLQRHKNNTYSQSMCSKYPILMHNENDRSNIPGYVSIKEAAKILGISANRVYAYVEEGRLPSAKAAHVIMIPLKAVEDFKPQLSGRPRTSVPVWRISPEENTILATSMLVRIRSHQHAKLMTRLEEMRRGKQHSLILGESLCIHDIGPSPHLGNYLRAFKCGR